MIIEKLTFDDPDFQELYPNYNLKINLQNTTQQFVWILNINSVIIPLFLFLINIYEH